MPRMLIIDWTISPLVFMEFFVVLAFGIGWFILEKVANSYDRNRDGEGPEPGDDTSPPP